MLSKLKSFFASFNKSKQVHLLVDKNGDLASDELIIAILVLMTEIAIIDGEIASEEIDTVINLVVSILGVPQEVLLSLIDKAVKLREEKGKINEFVDLINNQYSYEQKIVVLSLIWSLVYADNKIDEGERRFLVQIRNRLKISDKDGEKAMLLAKNRV
jgi:uncharacterized tellurite resistance protein B-like protein